MGILLVKVLFFSFVNDCSTPIHVRKYSELCSPPPFCGSPKDVPNHVQDSAASTQMLLKWDLLALKALKKQAGTFKNVLLKFIFKIYVQNPNFFNPVYVVLETVCLMNFLS